MLEIRNTEVFGIDRAIKASGNPMTVGEINTKVNELDDFADDKAVSRASKLGSSPNGSAHDHFLCGIQVTFDIKYPQYFTIEAERYHWWTIISSQSKIHRLTTMGKDETFECMFNEWVDDRVIRLSNEFIDDYNLFVLKGERTTSNYEEVKYHKFMTCISNLPMGFEMWMTCQCSYLQLKTIYFQRKNHKLKNDWGNFCDWCLQLPMFKELIGIGE